MLFRPARVSVILANKCLVPWRRCISTGLQERETGSPGLDGEDTKQKSHNSTRTALSRYRWSCTFVCLAVCPCSLLTPICRFIPLPVCVSVHLTVGLCSFSECLSVCGSSRCNFRLRYFIRPSTARLYNRGYSSCASRNFFCYWRESPFFGRAKNETRVSRLALCVHKKSTRTAVLQASPSLKVRT